MGKGPQQTFLQRRNTDGWQTHEKLLNTAHSRNENLNYNEIPPHTSQWPSSKSLQIINAGEGVEEKELSYTVGGNLNWYNHYGKQYTEQNRQDMEAA